MEREENQAEAVSRIAAEAIELLKGNNDVALMMAFIVQSTSTPLERVAVLQIVTEEVKEHAARDRYDEGELFLLDLRKAMGRKASTLLIGTRRH